jgi:hypothetical protein
MQAQVETSAGWQAGQNIANNSQTVYNNAIATGSGQGEAYYESGAYVVGSFTGYTPAYQGYSGTDVATGQPLTTSDRYIQGGTGTLAIIGTGFTIADFVMPTGTTAPTPNPPSTGASAPTYDVGETMPNGQTAGVGPGAQYVGENTSGGSTVVIAQGAGYQSATAGGTVYLGGYDPLADTLYLGDSGHANGMADAGGTPIEGMTPGITVIETGSSVTWSADSMSLASPELTDQQINQIQAGLETQFPGKSVTIK